MSERFEETNLGKDRPDVADFVTRYFVQRRGDLATLGMASSLEHGKITTTPNRFAGCQFANLASASILLTWPIR